MEKRRPLSEKWSPLTRTKETTLTLSKRTGTISSDNGDTRLFFSDEISHDGHAGKEEGEDP
jgi:hypothetical protein